MPSLRPSYILVAICFLAVSCSNGPPPLAQASVLAPVLDPPTEAESQVEESKAEEKKIEKNPIYDTTNPAYPALEKANEIFANLPFDKKGAIDWMKALNSGAIIPRAGFKVSDKLEILDMDITMKNTKEMPYVKFPHGSHTQWLTCGNCHEEIFIPKAGANPVTMTKIFKGQYCGACHSKVAFATTTYCERCHSIPIGGSKSWWYPW